MTLPPGAPTLSVAEKLDFTSQTFFGALCRIVRFAFIFIAT
jgi:hypothetical protein